MDDDLKAVVDRIEKVMATTGPVESAVRCADLRTLLSALRQRDEALTELLALPVAVRELAVLDLGIGTKIENAAWLRARAILTGSETNAR